MVKYTRDQLKAQFAKLGYDWPNFHLIGIRAKNYVADSFCDTLIVLAGTNISYYSITTRPGVYYLDHLLNPKGCAVLKPGQWKNCWALGYHKNDPSHPAFIQVGPITVFRDADKDGKALDHGGYAEDTGYFGIDIHRAIPGTTTAVVDRWSAGCQVFATYQDEMNTVQDAKASGEKFFTYTLLEEF